MKKIFADFRDFITRGNVVDLAVGIIIGSAFSSVVNSIVNNLMMPPLGFLLGKVDFQDLFIVLKQGEEALPSGATLQMARDVGAVTFNYGLFLADVISFLILALGVFLMVKGLRKLENKIKKSAEAAAEQPTEKECPYCLKAIPIGLPGAHTAHLTWRKQQKLMNKDILVAILEDDVFSRNWMALLMVRDWRTRLVGEFSTHIELCECLNNSYQPFDLLIFDVDLFGEDFSVSEICDSLSEVNNKAKILLTGIQPEERIVKQMGSERVCGYVLKNEVGYSLSWVITFAYEEQWVFTPGTMALASDMNYIFPKTNSL